MTKIARVYYCLVLALASVIAHSASPLADIVVRNKKVSLDPSYTISATPPVLHGYGADWIRVFYETKHPHHHDWIGVYTPDVAALTTKAPTRYQMADKSSGYLQHGRGTLQFRLINVRAEFIIGYFTNGTDHPVLKAYSKPISFANPNQPLQGHLALTDNVNEMRLSWGGGGNVNNYVKWGTESKKYHSTAQAATSTYTAQDFCGSPATDYGWMAQGPGPLHTAVMTELKPQQRYFYVYGNDVNGWSPESNFSGPIPASSRGVSIVAYGDLGRGNVDDSEEEGQMRASLNTTREVTGIIEDTDLVLHIGDISYARGYAADWDQFMHQMLPITSRVPYMTLLGNHERDYPNSGSYYNGTDSGGECGIAYEMRFNMPRASRDQAWYSFNYGNVHFVMMSTEHDFRVGSVQNQFLSRDLASVDRSKTPWVIFNGHRPMYIDSTANSSYASDVIVADLLRANVEPILHKHHVDLALWGHHHSYQRTCPIFNMKCGQGPVHIVIGMAGAGFSTNIYKVNPSWIEYINDDTHGYSTIKTTATELSFKFFANDNRELKDHVILKK